MFASSKTSLILLLCDIPSSVYLPSPAGKKSFACRLRLRLGEDVLYLASLYNLAFLDDCNLVADLLDYVHLVSDYYECDSELAVNLLKKSQY